MRVADGTRASVVVLCVRGGVSTEDRSYFFWSGLPRLTQGNNVAEGEAGFLLDPRNDSRVVPIITR